MHVNVGEVNCTLNWELCKRYKVSGYPSTMFFDNRDASLNDYYEYHGEATIAEWKDYTVDGGFERYDDHEHDD